MINHRKNGLKGTIVCIHGNSSSAKVFAQLTVEKELAWNIKAIELKGHGENQSPNYGLNDFSFSSQKEFILNQVKIINGDILLVGNSLGGHLAIEVANEIQNLKGLVIMGTPPVKEPINFAQAFNPVEELNVFFNENPSQQAVIKAVNCLVNNQSISDSIINDFQETNPLVRKAAAIDIAENNLNDEFLLFTKLNVPKFVIVGDSDPTVNRDYLRFVKANSQNKCEIIEIPACGHFPSIDKPIQFAKIIRGVTKLVMRNEAVHRKRI